MPSMTDLFVQQPVLSFSRTKSAGIEVDENPEQWARQVLSDLYLKTPEIAEYTPTVMFMKTDPEQGFALGAVVLANTTDSALATTRMSSQSRKVLIPIIIKNHNLCPMDLLLTSKGKMMPLNGGRLREALFRPDTFEMVTEDYADSSLWNMFYPPGRSDNSPGAGMSGGADSGIQTIHGPGMKMGSQTFELLDGIVGPSMLGPDLDALVAALEQDPALKLAAVHNDNLSVALQILAAHEGSATRGSEDMFKAAADVAPPCVIQLGYDEPTDRYTVKRASRVMFYHSGVETLGRRDFLKFAGEEIAQKVDTDGTVTLALQPVVDMKIDPSASKWKLVEYSGIYKVKTVAGKELTGWVLTGLLDTDGTRMPMSVFTNGSAATMQSDIVGVHVATGVDLPAAPAKGTGLFYVSGQGGIEATIPVVIEGREAGMDGGDSYLVRTLSGEKSRVRLIPGIQVIRALGSELMLPLSAKFLPLDQETMIHLIDSVDGLSKTSSLKGVRVLGTQGDFQFDYLGLPKLAEMFPRHLTHDPAMMMLCLGGLTAQDAETKLAASEGHSLTLSDMVDVSTAMDALQESRKVATKDSLAIRALRQDLIKEATVLPNVQTVDSVLSLGFINSENIRMFISRLPYLEKSLSMLCELVLVSRLGLSEIPEAATSRCVRGLDDTIQGLRALSMRGPDDVE